MYNVEMKLEDIKWLYLIFIYFILVCFNYGIKISYGSTSL